MRTGLSGLCRIRVMELELRICKSLFVHIISIMSKFYNEHFVIIT